MEERRIVLDVLKGETVFPPPIWMMRQAGRYLPEYRASRAEAGSFLDLCYNPDFAVEVTLQPIRRFDFDASILFSDILVVPHALGRDLRFEEGRGPLMTPITPAEVERLSDIDPSSFHVNLAPVYETVRRLRAELPGKTTLLGFCGAPWTVATPDQAPARLFAFSNPREMRALLSTLAERSADYLIRQIEAGADAVQIFDSWAGVLDEEMFATCCVEPVRRMVERVRAVFPDTPIIGFPRGAGALYDEYRQRTGVTALGLDWSVSSAQARRLQRDGAVQGNLDPLRLQAGGAALEDGVASVLRTFADGPFIFNLGHGVTQHTPVAHVERMVELVREAKR
jgi:uroporphyrinogen decarboxylase